LGYWSRRSERKTRRRTRRALLHNKKSADNRRKKYSDNYPSNVADNFREAWFAYWKKWYTITASGLAGTAFVHAIEQVLEKGLALSPLGWVAGLVLLVILVISLFYAAWAPADPIALDILAYTERQLFDMTDANLNVVPEPTWQRIHQLHMTSESLGKKIVPGGVRFDLFGTTTLPQYAREQPLQPGLSLQADLTEK
jgi:hypothetical protein